MKNQLLIKMSTQLMIRKLFCVLLLSFHVTSVYADDANQTAINFAMGTLDKFMLEFNKRDLEAVAATLNYPHVRFASGNVVIFEGAKSFVDRPLYETLTDSGWDHSHWLSREVVLSSSNKVHIATAFRRYNESNEPIGTYESLYIVTQKHGRWGIQARSSLAP
jgi:hypothetical protein